MNQTFTEPSPADKIKFNQAYDEVATSVYET